eukprot:3999118-Lingulodinium_polyedra.AAC.1
MPRPWRATLPLLNVRKRPRRTKIDMDYPVMSPHELLAFMYLKNRSEFNDFMLGTGSPRDCWAQVPMTDHKYVGHPAKAVEQKA